MNMFNPYLIDEASELILSNGTLLKNTQAGAEVLRMAREYAKLMCKESDRPRMPIDTFVVRKEDMSRNGRLRLFKQDDGDVCVSVVEDDGTSAGIEFCVPGTGGGKSPKTLSALNVLALAIEEDNEADPSRNATR